MPGRMKHISRETVAQALNELPPSFDTHDVERRILRRRPAEFAQELLTFQADVDRLMRFSMVFSRWLGSTFSTHIGKSGVGKIRTLNLGGEPSASKVWRKVAPAARID